MLVLSGKKIRLVVFSTFAVFLLLALSVNLTNEKSKYIETVALPVSGKVVVVDAGHGIPDERSCLLTLKITLIFYKK